MKTPLARNLLVLVSIMSAMTLQEVRSRIIETAIDLGWTPPGWRSAPYPEETRVLDRIGDLALAALFREQTRGQKH